jgi:hypothetical protein
MIWILLDLNVLTGTMGLEKKEKILVRSKIYKRKKEGTGEIF